MNTRRARLLYLYYVVLFWGRKINVNGPSPLDSSSTSITGRQSQSERSRSCAAWFSDANMQRSSWHATGEMTLGWHCLIHPMWGQTIVWRGWESFTIAAAAFIGGFLSGSVLTIASPVYTTGPASRHCSRVVVAYQDIWNQETTAPDRVIGSGEAGYCLGRVLRLCWCCWVAGVTSVHDTTAPEFSSKHGDHWPPIFTVK